MSRLTVGNTLKVIVAILFFIFMPLIVLMLGILKKNGKVIAEGALYVVLFAAAFSTPEESPLFSLASFVGLGVIAISALRFYMLRDLWLDLKNKGQLPNIGKPQPNASRHDASAHHSQSGTSPTSDARELSRSLDWVASQAKQNKNRLPTTAYVSILETCHTLDAVVDAEAQQPMGDPQFEYELAAIVRDYLPAVLRGYLALPPSVVGNRQTNGKTADEELLEQLQLLSGQADALHSSRHRQNSADMTNTGNFLRERFGYQQGGGFDFGIK